MRDRIKKAVSGMRAEDRVKAQAILKNLGIEFTAQELAEKKPARRKNLTGSLLEYNLKTITICDTCQHERVRFFKMSYDPINRALISKELSNEITEGIWNTQLYSTPVCAECYHFLVRNYDASELAHIIIKLGQKGKNLSEFINK